MSENTAYHPVFWCRKLWLQSIGAEWRTHCFTLTSHSRQASNKVTAARHFRVYVDIYCCLVCSVFFFFFLAFFYLFIHVFIYLFIYFLWMLARWDRKLSVVQLENALLTYLCFSICIYLYLSIYLSVSNLFTDLYLSI